MLVILSEGRSPKSKDLRTDFTAAVPQVRRSFDSLCSLRMTNFGDRADSPGNGGRLSWHRGTARGRSLHSFHCRRKKALPGFREGIGYWIT